jgi:hypothetical protein
MKLELKDPAALSGIVHTNTSHSLPFDELVELSKVDIKLWQRALKALNSES